MQDRPTARELLEAAGEFLREEVAQALDGRLRFHARVAANVLQIVARELEFEPEHLRAEWSRLDALLGSEPPPAGVPELRRRLRERTALLCERLRRHDLEADELARIREHVRATVREKLRIAHPEFLDRAGAAAGTEGAGEERGAGLVVVLLALLVLAALYFGLPALRPAASPHGAGGDPGLAALERAQEAACRTSRQMLERSIVLWRSRHPGLEPSVDDLAREGIRVSRCPEGGDYEIVAGRVYCTVHDPPP